MIGRARLACACVCVLAGAGAIAAEGEPPTAVLYVRPVQSGSHGRTRFELLAEANQLTAPLAAAVARARGQRVLTPAELEKELGRLWRPQVFECRERLGCLAPSLASLFRAGLRSVVLATVEANGDDLELALYRVSLKPYKFDGSVTVRLRRNPPPTEDELYAKLRRFLAPESAGAPPDNEAPPPEARTEPKPEPKPEPPRVTPSPHAIPAPPAPAPDTGEDVVESLDVVGATQSPSSAPPPPPPPDRLRIGGWARASLEVGFVDGQHKTPPDPLTLPRDRLIARGQIFTRAQYSRGHWFEAVASGLLHYGLFERGPADAKDAFTGFNGQTSRNVVEATLYDASIGFFSKYLDFRIGQQRIAWGRGDIFSPNDVVNARDIRDPLLAETDTLHLPQLLLRFDIDLRRFGQIQLLYAPFLAADKFDVYGTNWAGLQPGAPALYRGLFNLAAIDPTLQPLLASELAQLAPRYRFSDGEAGARYTLSLHNTDLSAYYHYGYDRMPTFTVDPQAAMTLANVDFNTIMPGQLAQIPQMLSGGHLITADYVRRHHAGADASTIVGPVALRFEAAYDSARVFYRTDLTSFITGTVQLAAAVEYQTGDPGKVVLFEITYLHLVDAPPAPLLGASQDTAALGTELKWTFLRRLQLELRGGIGVQPFTFVLRPQIAVNVGDLSFRLGALILGGDNASFGGYYRDNTSLYTMIKYAF